MSRFKVQIVCDNQAFVDDLCGSVDIALKEAAVAFRRAGDHEKRAFGVIRDLNGNTVGTWDFEP